MKSARVGPSEFLKKAKQKEVEVPARVIAEISSDSLLNNYRSIQELVPHQFLLPMLKADAYGHGATWTAQNLSGLSQLYGFGVATLQEGAELRASLGPRMRRVPILIFSESTPWTEEKGNFCQENGLRPIITSETDWNEFYKHQWMNRISYEIQFNTGMNRLGLSPSNLGSLIKNLRSIPAEYHPSGVLSHLAKAEDPEAKLSLTQIEKFKSIRAELSGILPGTRFHLGNSSAIWNHKSYGLKDLTDVVRPGLALYGIPPWPGAPERGILPVMSLRASVVAIHRLKPGDSLGYGGTFKVSGTEPVFAAVLGAGYADGVKRALGNQGYAWLDGKSTRFIGNVSMDLCTIQASAQTRVGSWAELLGPHVDPWAQAQAAGTIPYELLTSVSHRVKRMYDIKFSNPFRSGDSTQKRL